MYTIPTKDLKSFFSASQHIQPGTVLPIYQYMRILFTGEHVVITKCNAGFFYSQTVDIQNEPGTILIESGRLQDFISDKSAQSVTLTPYDGGILVSDGKTKLKCPTIPASEFPVMPTIDGESEVISDEMVLALKKAINFYDENNARTKHVFIGNGFISATNDFSIYYHPWPGESKLALYKEIVSALPGAVDFYRLENWFAFTTLTGTYLFIKPEINFMDLTIFATLPAGRTTEVNKDEFMSFLKDARKQCKDKVANGTIKQVGMELQCRMVDAVYGADVSVDIQADGTPFSFKFSVDYMMNLVKQIESPVLEMYLNESGNQLYIKDTNFITAITKMV